MFFLTNEVSFTRIFQSIFSLFFSVTFLLAITIALFSFKKKIPPALLSLLLSPLEVHFHPLSKSKLLSFQFDFYCPFILYKSFFCCFSFLFNFHQMKIELISPNNVHPQRTRMTARDSYDLKLSFSFFFLFLFYQNKSTNFYFI